MADVSKPYFSIITPCLNREMFISSAVDSVLQQARPQLEHLVIDGGSTDGSLELLRHYPHLRVISEPDNGVYDALNKGLQLAQGEVIGFLNTDDLYTPGILPRVAELFTHHPDTLAVLGGARIYEQLSGSSQRTLAEYPPYHQDSFLEQVTWGVPLFNAWFFRRVLFDRYGSFDVRYRFAADRDFLIRLALDSVPFTIINRTAYHYRHHPASLTFNHNVDAESGMVREFREIAEKYLQRYPRTVPEGRCFRRWHSLVTSHQALLAMSNLQGMKSLHYARIGLRHDPTWLWVFSRELAGSGARRLLAHHRLRPRSMSQIGHES